MASAYSMMKHNLKTTHHSHKPGVVGIVLGTGAELAGGAGLGYMFGRFRDKWYGKYLPYVVALSGKAVAVGAAATGHGTVATVANDFGKVGTVAIGLNWGVKKGLKARGLKAVAMTEAEAAKLPAADVLGDLSASTARGMDRAAVDDLYKQYA